MSNHTGRLGLGVVMSLGLAGPAIGADLAELMPEGTLLYVQWPGIDRLSETASETELAALMTEPEGQRFRRQWRETIWPAIESAIGGAMGEDMAEQVYPPVMSLARSVWKHPTAFGVIGVGMGEAGPQLDAGLIVRAGKDAQELAGAIDRLIQTAPIEPDILSEVTVAGATFRQLLDPQMGIPVRWGVIGEDLVVAVGTKLTDRIASLDQGKGLAASERFAAAARVTGCSADTPAIFVDLRGIIDTLDKFQVMFAGLEVPILGEEGGVKQLLTKLGLEKVQSFSATIRPEEKGFKSAAFLHVPGATESAGIGPFGIAGKPVTDDDLKVVPQEVAWASVSRFDLAKFYTGVYGLAAELMPDVHDMLSTGVDVVETELDVEIVEILGALGDTWAFYDAPAAGGLWVTGITVVTKTDRTDKLDQILTRLVQVLAEQAGAEDAVSVRTETYRDQKISFVNVAGAPMPVAPAWAAYEGHWVAGLYPQIVRAALDQLIDKESSLLDNPDYRRCRAHLSKEVTSISYVDTAAGVGQLYRFALPLGQTLVAMGQGQGIPLDIGLLPSLSTFTRRVYGSVSASSTRDDGWLWASHGMAPAGSTSMGSSVMITSMITSVALPSLAQARAQARRTVSAANLMAIGMACHAYASENDGKFPNDFETLIEIKAISESSLITPADDTDDDRSYVYVAGQTIKGDPRNVLAHEKRHVNDGEGVTVLCMDGHVQFMAMEEFERALAATNERLGR